MLLVGLLKGLWTITGLDERHTRRVTSMTDYVPPANNQTFGYLAADLSNTSEATVRNS